MCRITEEVKQGKIDLASESHGNLLFIYFFSKNHCHGLLNNIYFCVLHYFFLEKGLSAYCLKKLKVWVMRMNHLTHERWTHSIQRGTSLCQSFQLGRCWCGRHILPYQKPVCSGWSGMSPQWVYHFESVHVEPTTRMLQAERRENS